MAVAFAWALISNSGAASNSHNIANCKHAGKGQYLVTYKTPFAASPGVQATPFGTASSAGVTISLNIMAMNMCEVLTWDANGKSADCGFSFLAVGDV